MRKSILWIGTLIALTLLCLAPAAAPAATMSWSPTTTAVNVLDNSVVALTAADQARIVYTPYHGTSAQGPWTAETPTPPGATSATVQSPAKGQTLWYTVDATLDGERGAKAQPVSFQVPFPVPSAPTNLKIAP